MFNYIKIFGLLNSSQKRGIINLLVFMVIAMILEVIGIGILIPILSTIASPESYQNSLLFENFSKYTDLSSPSSFATSIVIIFIIIYGVKFLFLVYFSWKQADYVWNLQAEFSTRMYKVYLKQEYSFFFNRNTSELLRNTFNEVALFSSSVMALTNLTAEILVLLGITILLIFFNPIVALSVILITSVSALIFYLLIRNKLKTWGEKRQFHESSRIKTFQHGFGAIKDIKVMGREDNLISMFSFHSSKSSHMSKFNSLLQAIPRLWLEFFAVLSIGVAVFIIVEKDQIDLLVPILGVFAVAAFRIMPSFNRILYSLQQLRFTSSVIENLNNELNLQNSISSESSEKIYNFTDKIEFKDVDYIYPNKDIPALKNINLKIFKGDKIGIIGPNGSGKSTLLDLILCLINPSNGKIYLDDDDIVSNKTSWQKNIGYVSQNIFLTDDTLRNNIAIGFKDHEIEKEIIDQVVIKSKLQDLISTLPAGINTVVGERGIKLSGGQIQRIAIARSLYHNPQVLIFDEASSALDIKTEEDLFNNLELFNDKTVIIVTHRHSTLKNCNILVEMGNGSITNIIDKNR